MSFFDEDWSPLTPFVSYGEAVAVQQPQQQPDSASFGAGLATIDEERPQSLRRKEPQETAFGSQVHDIASIHQRRDNKDRFSGLAVGLRSTEILKLNRPEFP